MRREIEREVESLDQVLDALDWVMQWVKKGLQGGEPVVIRLGRKRRTLDQNRKLWPMCSDVSAQVQWHGAWLSKEDWKDLFTGSLKRQRPVQGISLDGEPGGVVFLGGGSSKLTVKEFSELIDFIEAFGAEHNVAWSKQSQESIDWARERRDESA